MVRALYLPQVVWVGSTELGVGVAEQGQQRFVVANYSPPGNYMVSITLLSCFLYYVGVIIEAKMFFITLSVHISLCRVE